MAFAFIQVQLEEVHSFGKPHHLLLCFEMAAISQESQLSIAPACVAQVTVIIEQTTLKSQEYESAVDLQQIWLPSLLAVCDCD